MVELVGHFRFSPERAEILRGLIEYRKRLKGIGITQGFQWMDGSFLEDVEGARNRPPNDIDFVTFAHRPITHRSNDAWQAHWSNRPDLFDPNVSKQAFKCDAYYVDLDLKPEYIVEQTRYWFGLFSHQKSTDTWKGLIEIPLSSDDFESRKLVP